MPYSLPNAPFTESEHQAAYLAGRRCVSPGGLSWWEWTSPEGVRQLELTGEGLLSEAETDARAADFVSETDAELILRGQSADIYKPREESVMSLLWAMSTGAPPFRDLQDRLLVTVRTGVFDRETCVAAREALREAARISLNRGVAAGKIDTAALDHDKYIVVGGTRVVPYKQDGSLSRTSTANPVASGIVGFFDANPRNPYCRQTAFTAEFPERFAAAVPLVQAVSEQYRQLIPKRWASQEEFAARHHTAEKGWLVPGTVFTTITVNRNFRTALHTDKGDLAEGFGNLVVLEGDGPAYEGGVTVFPRFRVGVDLRMGDFLGMDVHEWHGNTALRGEEGYERISVVCYYRERVKSCGTQEEEARRHAEWKAKRAAAGEAADPVADELQGGDTCLTFMQET
jgi:hypothetical protein